MAGFEDLNQSLDRELLELSGETIKYGSFSAENFGVVLISNKEKNEESEVKALRYFELNNFTKEDGEWCMQNLERSYFSHKNQKTYDDNVRYSVSTKTFHIQNWDFLEHYLRQKFSISKSYLIEPYKFNCYGSGCFFGKHIDTPSTGMLGTLIIIPNSRFSGGEFVFNDFFQPSKIDLAKAIAEKLDKRIVQSIYFDKNKEHEVLKVTEGFRCSLVYKVLESKNLSVFSCTDAKLIPRNYFAATVDKDFCKRFAIKCFNHYKDKTNILVSTEMYPEEFIQELKNLFKNYEKVYHIGDETIPDLVYGEFHPPSDDESETQFYTDELDDYVESPYKVHFVMGNDIDLFHDEERQYRTWGQTGNSPIPVTKEYTVKTGLLLNAVKKPDNGSSHSSNE